MKKSRELFRGAPERRHEDTNLERISLQGDEYTWDVSVEEQSEEHEWGFEDQREEWRAQKGQHARCI